MGSQEECIIYEDTLRNAVRINQTPVTFGICFDVDGVLARGTVAIEAALTAFEKLLDEDRKLMVPVAFVTNALNTNIDKATQIANWFQTEIESEQMIQSPCPLEVFAELKDKFCLAVGQGKVFQITKELGFKTTCTVEEITEAYPLLDMVDHDNRERVANEGYEEKEFPKVEAILLLGEPRRWESALQIIIDLLRTNGEPNKPPTAELPNKQLPVIACNMDLEFMERAITPRFAHGAFLACLEALYLKIFGHNLQYTALMGKPSEITFRYAEHVLSRQADKLGYNMPLRTMYLIGDAPDADIVGINLYRQYLERLRKRRTSIDNSVDLYIDTDIPPSRNMPPGAAFYPQSVEEVEGLLVRTGVYKPGGEYDLDAETKNHQIHRDFPKNIKLRQPTVIMDDVNEAIDYIIAKELKLQ